MDLLSESNTTGPHRRVKQVWKVEKSEEGWLGDDLDALKMVRLYPDHDPEHLTVGRIKDIELDLAEMLWHGRRFLALGSSRAPRIRFGS